MDFRRIATIIGVAVIGFIGYYATYIIYNILQFLFAGPNNGQTTLAIITAIVVAIIYTIKTRRQ